MQRYLIFRIGQSIVALIGVTMIVFALTRISGNMLDIMLPEDATAVDYARISEAWGLDKPMVVQYGIYVKNILNGDWGRVVEMGRPTPYEIVLQQVPRDAAAWRRLHWW